MVFEDITGLAVKHLAYLFECGKPYCFSFAGFEYGKVSGGDVDTLGKFLGGHLAFRHHNIEVYDDRPIYITPLYSKVVLRLYLNSFFKDVFQHTHDQSEHYRSRSRNEEYRTPQTHYYECEADEHKSP